MIEDLDELILTCKSWQQAQQVVDTLLENHLVMDAEIISGKDAQKVHVLVKTSANSFEKIKSELNQLPGGVIVSGASLVQ